MEPNLIRDDNAVFEEESGTLADILGWGIITNRNFSHQETERRELKRLVNQQMTLNREIASQQTKLRTLESE